MNPYTYREYAQDFVAAVVLVDPSTDEGKTGLTTSDIEVATWDPTTGMTAVAALNYTWSELDSTNHPGLYQLTVSADVLEDTEAIQAVALHPSTAGAFPPVSWTFHNVPMGWRGFFARWEAMTHRLNEFLDRNGVTP